MNHTHLHRSLIILLFILVSLTFIVGILRAFTPAHAISNAALIPSVTLALKTPSEHENKTLGSTPTVTNAADDDSDENFTPTPTPYPILESAYADTNGILALAIVVVVVILVGVAWGGLSQRKKKRSKG